MFPAALSCSSSFLACSSPLANEVTNSNALHWRVRVVLMRSMAGRKSKPLLGQTTSEDTFGNKAQPAARHSGQDVSCLLGVEVVAAGCPLRSHVSANDA